MKILMYSMLSEEASDKDMAYARQEDPEQQQQSPAWARDASAKYL